MKWDRILRRLENKVTLNKQEYKATLNNIEGTSDKTFEYQRLGMVKSKLKKHSLSLQEAIRYVKRNRSTYPLTRIERMFHITMRGR